MSSCPRFSPVSTENGPDAEGRSAVAVEEQQVSAFQPEAEGRMTPDRCFYRLAPASTIVRRFGLEDIISVSVEPMAVAVGVLRHVFPILYLQFSFT